MDRKTLKPHNNKYISIENKRVKEILLICGKSSEVRYFHEPPDHRLG